MAADVLYVSFDGVLQPLGFSQVVRVLAGLGRRALRYHLLSLERPTDLDDAVLRSAVHGELDPARVAWTHLPAQSMRTPKLAATALGRMVGQAASIVRSEGVRLVHARGYHAALVARALERLLGVPYLFDARGYWIEERSGPGGWFAGAAAYAGGKLVEQLLFRGARAVVSLTELQAGDLASGLFGPPPPRVEVIPTCADYEAFTLRDSRPAQPETPGVVPEEVRRALAGKNVVAIVGALNATYCVRETLLLAKAALARSAATHLLVLSAQGRDYAEALAAAGIAPDRRTIASAPHWAMPDWLQWIDWGLLLVPETQANRAKMPTKLAEFFASGVRPAFFGCNSDAARWVERAGSGYVLRSTSPGEIEAAAGAITGERLDASRLKQARAVTAPHFSLENGVERYRTLVGDLLARRNDAGRSNDS